MAILFRVKEVVKVRYVSDARDFRWWDVERILRIFLASESIVSVTMVDGFEGEKNSRFGRGQDDRWISLRRINAAIKGRECRVLAPLKRRLAPPPCNLRRDYDVRLRNPVGTERSFPLPVKFLLVGISIRADNDRIACRKRQLFGQRLLNSFRVANLIVMGRYLHDVRSIIRAESVLIAPLFYDKSAPPSFPI